MVRYYIYCIQIILILLIINCKKNDYPYKFHQADFIINIKSSIDLKYNKLPENINLTCGTVSHHLLVSGIINDWFIELKNHKKNIDTFFILSPKHDNYTNSLICLSSLDWKVNNEIIKTNKKYINKIINLLQIKEDRGSFHSEHGISSLLPFIKKYYPDALIVPILTDEYKKQNSKTFLLADVISQIMKENKNSFLIISADFSHNADKAETVKRDAENEKILKSLDINLAGKIWSDNSCGMLLLFKVCNDFNIKKNHIFYHTDSGVVSLNNDLDNITSYFFTFQYQ